MSNEKRSTQMSGLWIMIGMMFLIAMPLYLSGALSPVSHIAQSELKIPEVYTKLQTLKSDDWLRVKSPDGRRFISFIVNENGKSSGMVSVRYEFYSDEGDVHILMGKSVVTYARIAEIAGNDPKQVRILRAPKVARALDVMFLTEGE